MIALWSPHLSAGYALLATLGIFTALFGIPHVIEMVVQRKVARRKVVRKVDLVHRLGEDDFQDAQNALDEGRMVIFEFTEEEG
jgi:hypothetical protein